MENRIRQLREKGGLTQETLAIELEITQQQLSTVKILQRIQHFWQQYMITCQLHIGRWKDTKMLLIYAQKG